MASGSPMYLRMHTHGVFTYSPVYCPACEMSYNGMGQYNDHARSKKHRHNLNKRIGHERRDRRDKKLVIPRGTALIIEQGAILRDAAEQYTLRLYSRAAAQAAKAAPQGSDVGPSTYAGPAATSQGGPAATAQGGEDVPIMLLELRMEITEIRMATELRRAQCAELRRELRRMETELLRASSTDKGRGSCGGSSGSREGGRGGGACAEGEGREQRRLGPPFAPVPIRMGGATSARWKNGSQDCLKMIPSQPPSPRPRTFINFR